MDEDLNWRPSARDIAAAEQLLANAAKFQTRLKILRALAENRDAPISMIASAAKTRSAVVKAFLFRWRAYGTQSVIAFGRPTRLNASDQVKLKAQIASGRKKSLEDVSDYFEAWFGIKDFRTTRAYCDRLGFKLPKSSRSGLKLHDSW